MKNKDNGDDFDDDDINSTLNMEKIITKT